MENKKMDKEVSPFSVMEAFTEFAEICEEGKEEDRKRKLTQKMNKLANEVGYDRWVKEERKLAKMGKPSSQPTILLTPQQDFSIPMHKHHVSEFEMVFIPSFVHSNIPHKLGVVNKLEGVIG